MVMLLAGLKTQPSQEKNPDSEATVSTALDDPASDREGDTEPASTLVEQHAAFIKYINEGLPEPGTEREESESEGERETVRKGNREKASEREQEIEQKREKKRKRLRERGRRREREVERKTERE